MKNIIKNTVVVLGCGLASSAFAILQDVADAPVSSKYEVNCHIKNDGSKDCLYKVYYKVLTQQGRENISRFDFTYSELDKLEVVKAEYFEPDSNKAIKLDKSMIDTKMSPNPHGGFSRDKQTSIAFPNIKKGTTVHYIVKIKRSAKPYFTGFFEEISLPPSVYRYDDYKVQYSSDKPIKVIVKHNDKFDITSSEDGKQVNIGLKKLPHFENYINEGISIGRWFIKDYARVILTHSTDIQDHFSNVARRYDKLLQAKLPEKVQKVVDEVKGQDSEVKINAFMQYIYDNYRYLGDWRDSERGHIPFELKNIVDNGYGDCKDLSTLLTAMLRNSGIDAQVAFIYRGARAEELLVPGFYTPNHAIVRAKVDDKTVWLDPTNPFFNLYRPLNDITNRWVIVLETPTQAKLDFVPSNEVERIVVNRTEALIGEESGKVEININYPSQPLSVNMSDRQISAKVTNDSLCKNNANELESNSCSIKRQNDSNFIIPQNYQMQLQLVDNRLLKEIAYQTYLYEKSSLIKPWNAFRSYFKNNNLTDIFLGEPSSSQYVNTIVGYKVDKANSCRVDSKWMSLMVDVKPVANGTQLNYMMDSKVYWITHQELISKEFQDIVVQGQKCAKLANLVITDAKLK